MTLTKNCQKCKQSRNISDYTKNSNFRDGHSYVCKYCQKLYREENKLAIKSRTASWRKINRKHLNEHLENWKKNNPEKMREFCVDLRKCHNDTINKIKLNPCLDCDKKFPTYCMEFDHRPGEKKTDRISKMIGHHSLKSILLEIKKCDLVCRNCHRIRTRSRMSISDWTKTYGNSIAFNMKTVDELRNKPCLDCNSSFPSEAMDFDHISDKVMNISKLKKRSNLHKLLLELSKCELVCANCHAVRTYTRDINKLRCAAHNNKAKIMTHSIQVSP
jgi:hypothetical protein